MPSDELARESAPELDVYIVVDDRGKVYLGSDLEGAWFSGRESDAARWTDYHAAADRAMALNDLFVTTHVDAHCSVRALGSSEA